MPVNALEKRSKNKNRRVAICPSSEGTAPDNLLLKRERTSSDDKLPSCVGNVPVKALEERNNSCRVEICPSSEGTAPDNLLLVRIRNSSDDKLPSCVGNVPVKALEESNKTSSLDNNPISVGRLPISPFPTTSTDET